MFGGNQVIKIDLFVENSTKTQIRCPQTCANKNYKYTLISLRQRHNPYHFRLAPFQKGSNQTFCLKSQTYE